LERLIEYLIAGGVHGIFLLGTTGEATNLSYQLRQDFIEKACAIINKRIPVMVGITDTSVTGSLEMAMVSKNAGADALVISTPYYLPMAQHEFVEYLAYLTPKLSLPFLLYNMPGCTKMHMSVKTVKKAKELGAIGIKDSSGDLGYLYALQEEFKDYPGFSIICGTELFIPESVIFGGSGGIAGGANIFPRLYVDLYEAALAKDMEKISRLRDIVIQVGEKIYNIGTNNSKHIKSIKCALSVIGICNDFVAQPFRRFNNEECEIIKQNIRELSATFPEIQTELSTLNL
jgi:2-dehydro-3-deoxy-D-pentonate aldolase